MRGMGGQRGSPRGPRMLGEVRHSGWKVVRDQEGGRDSRVGFAM